MAMLILSSSALVLVRAADDGGIDASIVPDVGATVRELPWVAVRFSVRVVGVDAGDLLVGGEPADSVDGEGAGPWVFRLSARSGRIVTLAWRDGHGIRSESKPSVAFTGSSWAYRVDATLPAADLVISEILASNPGGLEDADGDSPDWIELHNRGGEWVNLDGWSLTDDPDHVDPWPLPLRLLAPGDRLMVFASGKDRRPSGEGELHASFALDVDGEHLALLRPAGRPGDPSEVAFAYAPGYPAQRPGHSWGIGDDGGVGHFREPTPGDANGRSYPGFVADTKFDVDRGLHDLPFSVAITTETPDARIRYTTDGSAPDETTGRAYSGPVRVETTTILRAAAFRDDLIPTNVDTQSYIFVDDVVGQTGHGFPSRWGPVAADYAVDPDVTQAAEHRDSFRGDLLAVPTVSIASATDGIFGVAGIYSHPESRGTSWERPASVELVYPDGREGFQADAGVRIFGGASRTPTNTGKHSIRLVFRGEYGATRLEFPLFPQTDVSRFDNVMLRGGYNYKWTHSSATQQQRAQYARDEFARQSMVAIGGTASSGIYVHVYINGLYWGMYNAVERPDARFSAEHLGGDKDDYDVVKAAEPPVAISGDRVVWNEMFEVANGGLAARDAYQRMLGYLDVDNLIDYSIVNHYIGNVDAPVCICGANRPRNFYASRHRSDEGRFRFFLWDSEHSLSDTSVDRTELGVRDADDTPARLYARLRENAEFRMRFADHVHRHLLGDGALTPTAASDRWLANASRMERAVVGESARWGDYRRAAPYTRDDEWRTEQRRLTQSFFPARTRIVLSQYRADGLYPAVDAPSLHQAGGRVEPGFELVLTAPDGAIWYTLDGTDPREDGGEVSATAIEYEGESPRPIAPAPATCRLLVPAGPEVDGVWTAPEFDDSAWTPARTGVGFDRGDDFDAWIETDVEADLYGRSSSLYVRIPFTVEDPDEIVRLALRVRYDDGFVAWINGTRAAAVNAPEGVSWESSATASHPDASAVQPEEFDASSALAALRRGENILSIQALNSSRASSDMLLRPELLASRRGEGGVVLSGGRVMVRARALVGSEWSALEEATFIVASAEGALRISEIHYHPSEPPAGSPFEGKDFEFLELVNTGAETLDLSAYAIAGGIELDLATGSVSTLAPGEYAVIVRSEEAFRSRWGPASAAIAGEYAGSLSNGGEHIEIRDALGDLVLEVTYDDRWYPVTDGEGHSLHAVDPWAHRDSWSDPEAWWPSRLPGGSPGGPEPPPVESGLQLPGDVDQDVRLTVTDAVILLSRLFTGLSRPLPCDGATIDEGANLALHDVDGSGSVDISDAISLLGYLFLGGRPPALGVECVPIEGCPDACAP